MAKTKPLLARKLVTPLATLVDDRLCHSERMVLLALYSYLGKARSVYPSREQLCHRSGINSIQRISVMTSRLVELGWLAKRKKGWTGRNQYYLQIPMYMVWKSFGEALVTLDVTIAPEVTVTENVTPTVTGDVTPIVTPEVTINKQTILTNQINKPLMGESELFNFFFEQYPKQVGRKQALSEWNKLNLTEKDLNKIIINITDRLTQGVWSLETKQFIPHPANYLSGEQWDDELISRNNHEQSNKLSPTQRLRDNLFSKSNMV
ncbi:helix-turn-helix domain-containing protein [Porticoccaceae bacterium]|nr:helix-turn-helix domain-containing protein [Porticoccaceae bacterium]